MKLLDKLHFGNEEEPEVTYGTETFEEEINITIATVRVTTKSDKTITKEGVLHMNTWKDDPLEIREVSFDKHKIVNNNVVCERNEETLFTIMGRDYDFFEVVNRKTLHVEAEAEVNYKEVDGERTYTSISESSIEKEMIE